MATILATRLGTALRQKSIRYGAQQTGIATKIALPLVNTRIFTELISPTIRSNWATAPFSTNSGVQFSKRGRPGPGEGFTVNFIMQDGEEISVQAHEGESLLDVAWANDIDIEGACEASLACSTCHLILDPESFSKLEEPTDEENDMLDLAFGLTDTSRLGCQVLMNKDLDGIIAKLPTMTRNAIFGGSHDTTQKYHCWNREPQKHCCDRGHPNNDHLARAKDGDITYYGTCKSILVDVEHGNCS
ncbi:hypothetical protein EC991_001495 [Linnemannia zychae]|nr:hypothetical protein EC991_001495 [Linnemannia zychae]